MQSAGIDCQVVEMMMLSGVTDGLTVGLVSPGWPGGFISNGIVTCTATVRPALQRRGVRVFVLAWNIGEDHDGNDIVDLGNSIQESGALRRLAKKVAARMARSSSRDCVVVKRILREVRGLEDSEGLNLLEMEDTFGWAGRVASKSHIPVVVRVHGPHFLVGRANGVVEDAAYLRQVRAEGLGIQRAAAVCAPSQDVIDRVRDHYGLPLQDAELIPNAVEPARERDRWKLDGCDRKRILFIGRFDRCKGGDVIIDAFARAATAHPGLRLTFVGSDRGLVDDGGRKWQVEGYIEHRLSDRGLRQRIEYLGTLDHQEIVKLRKKCFVSVVCSRYENFPNVVLEAMAHGCPLVASDVGGIPEIIQHERNGLLCRPDDPDDLADKILALMGNPELAARLGNQAAKDCEERYHPDVIAAKTIEFYQEVIRRFESKRS